MNVKEISYKIIEQIGVISKTNMYTKELNIISWNGREPVFDVRMWKIGNDGKKIPLKGISMNKRDLFELNKLLGNVDLEA